MLQALVAPRVSIITRSTRHGILWCLSSRGGADSLGQKPCSIAFTQIPSMLTIETYIMVAPRTQLYWVTHLAELQPQSFSGVLILSVILVPSSRPGTDCRCVMSLHERIITGVSNELMHQFLPPPPPAPHPQWS